MANPANTPAYTIRKAGSVDIPGLNLIYNNIICEGGATGNLQPMSADAFTAWFHSHQQSPYYIHVVEIAGIAAGYFYFSPWRSGREAFSHTAELSFYLSGEYRGCGLGDVMVSRGKQLGTEAGIEVLLAIVLEVNKKSISLLQKHGFKQGGYFPGIAKISSEVCGQYILYCPL